MADANPLFFEASGGLEIIDAEFTVKAFHITDGQNSGNNKVGDVKSFSKWRGGGSTFHFNCGRTKSGDTAEFWNAHIPSNRNTFNHGADSGLYFAFVGTLTMHIHNHYSGADVTATFDIVGFSRGSEYGLDNWCFGGQTCEWVGDKKTNTVACTGSKSYGETVTWYFRRGGWFNARNSIEVSW